MDLIRKKALADKEFMGIIEDLYNDPFVQSLDKYKHHYNFTRLDHCIHVSYACYLFLKRKKHKYKYFNETVRGALLHDFFLYDWHTKKNGLPNFAHSYQHPRCAMEEAKKHFNINDIEASIILNHMFPLTIIPPDNIGAWLVIWFDKYYAVFETCFHNKLMVT